MRDCEQCRAKFNLGEVAEVRPATVYAMDSHPGGWGGYYCVPCADDLRFPIRDQLAEEPTA